jgi:hypothetical protein
LKQLVNHWRFENILVKNGERIENIKLIEKKLGYYFPNDFILYLQTVNGMENGEADSNLFYFWASELIISDANKVQHATPDSIFIGFADRIVIDSIYMIEVSMTRHETGRVAIKNKNIKIISANFQSFLREYLNNLGNQLSNWEGKIEKINQAYISSI